MALKHERVCNLPKRECIVQCYFPRKQKKISFLLRKFIGGTIKLFLPPPV